MSTREEALAAAAREYLRYRTTEARANPAAALAQPVQPAPLTNERVAKIAEANGLCTILEDGEVIWFDGDATPFARALLAEALLVQPAPEYFYGMEPNAEPLVQPAGDALPPIAAAQKPKGASPGRSPVVPGGLITSDAAASEPAGDVPKTRGPCLSLCQSAVDNGDAACVEGECVMAGWPAGDVRPASFSTEEVMVLTDYLTERTAKALQRPAGEDRADALRDALTGLLDHCADQGWWMEVHAVKVMDNARAVLAETQRPAPDKPAPGSTQ